MLRLLNFIQNNWGCLQDFRLVLKPFTCHILLSVFFIFTLPGQGSYHVVVVNGRVEYMFVSAYSQSFEKFKNGLLKMVVNPVDRSHFYTKDNRLKIPFYLTNPPLDTRNGQRKLCLTRIRDRRPSKLSIYHSTHHWPSKLVSS